MTENSDQVGAVPGPDASSVPAAGTGLASGSLAIASSGLTKRFRGGQVAVADLDLAVPALEEFVLSLNPYPRRPGVEFAPPNPDSAPPESPFAVLKSLK